MQDLLSIHTCMNAIFFYIFFSQYIKIAKFASCNPAIAFYVPLLGRLRLTHVCWVYCYPVACCQMSNPSLLGLLRSCNLLDARSLTYVCWVYCNPVAC